MAAMVVLFAVLPFVTPRFFKRYGGRPSELEAKFLLLVLFGLGGLYRDTYSTLQPQMRRLINTQYHHLIE